MIELYKGDEYEKENAKRKKYLTIFFILLATYIIICIAVVVSFAILPYGTDVKPFQMTNIILSVLFWGFCMFFYMVKHYRLKKYVKMLYYINSSKADTYTGYFLRINPTIEVKDGIEFYTLILLEWNPHKNENFERKVLVDNEIDKPVIEEGRLVKYQTQGNILLRYQPLNAYLSESEKQ